jgi:N-carbamoylputrescine amidase
VSTTAAVVQCRVDPDRARQRARVRGFLDEARASGARLVLLPELVFDPYPAQCAHPEGHARAEPVPGPTTAWLGEECRRLGLTVVTSLFERRLRGLGHNTAVVVDAEGRLAGIYRKMHIPDDPNYFEKYYFAPGDLGFVPVRDGPLVLGTLICWDQWFPEAARLMALAGADLLLYPTAIGWDPQAPEPVRRAEREAWTIVQRAHAIANALPVLVANRVGHEDDPSGTTPGLDFWGGSFIADVFGKITAAAGDADETVLLTRLEPEAIEEQRRRWPFLRDRRTDAYGGLLARAVPPAVGDDAVSSISLPTVPSLSSRR